VRMLLGDMCGSPRVCCVRPPREKIFQTREGCLRQA
jgi:hypothetical protein